MDNCRNIEPLFVARVLFGHSSFMYPVFNSTSFIVFREELCRRHKIKLDSKISLVYLTRGSVECILECEEDFRMMIYSSKVYSLKHIDVTVRLDDEVIFSKSSSNSIDLNMPCVEDEYLGLPFQDVEVKSYLSDEWAFYITGVGQKFLGGIEEFRDKLKKYAIHHGFFYVYKRNDSIYVTAICDSTGCEFYIKGSVYSVNKFFYIDECLLEHTCGTVLQKDTHKRLDSDIVSNCLFTDIMFNPTIGPTEIMKKFKLNYGYQIGYKVALNAKAKALEKIFGKESNSFDKLRWYIDAIQSTNPGSYVDMEVDQVTNKFRRIFVAYGACIEGLKYCVPILYIDGCHGKTMYKGNVLAASSRDGNKGMFPVAMCVCDAENEDNWNYFFRCLKHVIASQPHVITFISDRGLGLLKAFDQIFPHNPHLYCYHHLQNNLRNRYSGRGSAVVAKAALNAFFKCAYASTEKEYRFKLELLRVAGREDIIDDFLKDLPLNSWCRAFAVGCRFGIMSNTIAETFNNWISDERCMSAYSMLEEVRLKQMKWISDHKLMSNSWTTRITPAMEKDLKRDIKKSKKYRVVKSDGNLYEVRKKISYKVDLSSMTCSCVKWQINSFPCIHALAAIGSSKHDVYNFIHPVYHVEQYRKCYGKNIIPISNVEEMFFEADAEFIQPPAVKSQTGRRKKRRFKSAFEISSKRQIVCGRCGKRGNHNKLTCQEPINQN